MTYYSSEMQEMQIVHYHPGLSDWIVDVQHAYRESPSLFDTISGFSFHGQQAVGCEYIEPPLSGWENWKGEYDSCFDCCWGDNFFFNEDDKDKDNTYCICLEKLQDSPQSEEECNSSISYSGYADNHADYDYNPWSGYGFWSRDGEEEDPYNYCRQDLEPTYKSRPDEIGLCESIFGYWPCLLRNQTCSDG